MNLGSLQWIYWLLIILFWRDKASNIHLFSVGLGRHADRDASIT